MEDENPKRQLDEEPPFFDPSKPSVPISYPIRDLETLESRSYFDSFHYPFNRASVPVAGAGSELPARRRILVCHDMQGGYVDDRWIQGGSNPGAYAIWHWHLMDVFVYFSHTLVTIPPPCWTNAAHTHGVKVLGTFITEWDEGRDFCNELLSTEMSCQMYAERLAELAVALGFDGWLVIQAPSHRRRRQRSWVSPLRRQRSWVSPLQAIDAAAGQQPAQQQASGSALVANHRSSRPSPLLGRSALLIRPAAKGLLFGSNSRKMSSTAILTSSKVDISNSGLKLLVTEGAHAQKMIGLWLFGCAAWVFSLVVLGGITRLTRSGLSMTDWKFTGTLPPLSEEQWLLEFEKYQQSPEYKRVNKGMNMKDFKFIYWMEYAHRMWGRGLGVLFALPFTYFLAKGFITRRLGLRLSALFTLGAGQGLIGWWMVKSGLEEPASEYVQPRVSPYRLAAHLTSAFAIYCGILWNALSVVMPEPPLESISWLQGAAKLRKLVLPVSVLVGITAVSGAFVAGNNAGHAFNTFPKMGDSWIPDDIFSMEPLGRNFFENTSTVQLNHRILATTTLLSVGSLWLAARKIDMHPAVRSLVGSTLGMAALQVTLGISTLLSYVPVSLASAHQAGALTLLTLMILLAHTVRKPSPSLVKSLAAAAKV